MELLHGSSHGPVAIVLCCSLCFPAPLALAQQKAQGDEPSARAVNRREYVSSQLQGDERILHALNRFTFGPRPCDLEAVRAMGLEKWLDGQLHPASIDEANLNMRLALYPAMQWSTQNLVFRMPSPAMIRQAANGKIEIPPNGTLHAVYENQIYRFQARKAGQAEKQTNVAANPGTAPAGGAQRPGQIPGMAANANMDAGGSANMEAGDETMAPNTAGAAQQREMGGAAQPAAVQQRDMTAATPAANAMTTPATNVNQASPAPAPDEALIARILALPPEQRVRRLQSMQPEEFETFIKSLKPAQRVALSAGMTPDLRESIEDLATP